LFLFVDEYAIDPAGSLVVFCALHFGCLLVGEAKESASFEFLYNVFLVVFVAKQAGVAD